MGQDMAGFGNYERGRLDSERNCPLRQLAKWVEGRAARALVMGLGYLGKHDTDDDYPYFVEAEDNDAYPVFIARGEGPTLLDAAADAVRQLKERGEL